MGLLWDLFFLPVRIPIAILNALRTPVKIRPLPPSPDDERFTGYFENSRGQVLKIYKWKARAITSNATQKGFKVKGIVFLSHGFNEHLGRYDHVAEFFNKEGFDVYGIDHLGHGYSQGARATITNFDNLVEDYIHFVKYLLSTLSEEEQALPRVLLGHSMGGCLAVLASAQAPTLFSTVVLSGPMLAFAPEKTNPAMLMAGRVVRTFFPNLPIERIDPQQVSKDPVVVWRYEVDPVPSQRGIGVGTAMELFQAVDDATKASRSYRVPFAIFHGEEDTLTPMAGSKMLYENSPLPRDQKRLVAYPGLRHEIFREAEWQMVLTDMVGWVKFILKL